MHRVDVIPVDCPCPYCWTAARVDELDNRFWVWCVNFACEVQPRTDHYTTVKEAVSVWERPFKGKEVKVSAEVEELIKTYVAVRDELDTHRKAWQGTERKYKASLGNMEARLNAIMAELGVDQLKKAGIGTAFFKTTDFVNILDWEAISKFVVATDNIQMLQRRMAKAAVLEYMEDHEGELPPGLKYGVKKEIIVRRD